MRSLGSSGIEVGPIGLGCMGMSWGYGAAERDEERSVAVIRRALEIGVTLLDTSDIYGPFENE
ncbi:MAG: aldo/keto reductase, partial [Solirubrobacterales bacterium]|nr:aldo/keto reductase [Solirubrobacterales bacterium]